MCTIEGNNGTIAATGTTPLTATICLFPSALSDFTGTIAGDRHYTGIISVYTKGQLGGLESWWDQVGVKVSPLAAIIAGTGLPRARLSTRRRWCLLFKGSCNAAASARLIASRVKLQARCCVRGWLCWTRTVCFTITADVTFDPV